jgi:hypothetical protein
MRGGWSNDQKSRGRGMIFLIAKNSEELRKNWTCAAGRKLYRSLGGLLNHSRAIAQTELSRRPAQKRRNPLARVQRRLVKIIPAS